MVCRYSVNVEDGVITKEEINMPQGKKKNFDFY